MNHVADLGESDLQELFAELQNTIRVTLRSFVMGNLHRVLPIVLQTPIKRALILKDKPPIALVVFALRREGCSVSRFKRMRLIHRVSKAVQTTTGARNCIVVHHLHLDVI